MFTFPVNKLYKWSINTVKIDKSPQWLLFSVDELIVSARLTFSRMIKLAFRISIVFFIFIKRVYIKCYKWNHKPLLLPTRWISIKMYRIGWHVKWSWRRRISSIKYLSTFCHIFYIIYTWISSQIPYIANKY